MNVIYILPSNLNLKKHLPINMDVTKCYTSVIEVIMLRFENIIVEGNEIGLSTSYLITISPNGSNVHTMHIQDEHMLSAMRSTKSCNVENVKIDVTDVNVKLFRDSLCVCRICQIKDFEIVPPILKDIKIRIRFHNGCFEEHVTILRDIMCHIKIKLDLVLDFGVQIKLENYK